MKLYSEKSDFVEIQKYDAPRLRPWTCERDNIFCQIIADADNNRYPKQLLIRNLITRSYFKNISENICLFHSFYRLFCAFTSFPLSGDSWYRVTEISLSLFL